MKRILKAFMILLIILGIAGIGMFVTLTNNMKEIKAIEINEISLEALSDGDYIGMYYYEDQIGATVNVTVLNQEITNITFIEHIAGLGEKAEIIVEDIIRNQSIMVDDISGATTSSHVIKLAIKNALEEE